MVLLRERIRRLEDGSIKGRSDDVSVVRCDLLRRVIRGEVTRETMTPHERALYDNYVPWERPVGWLTVDELKAKIRG